MSDAVWVLSCGCGWSRMVARTTPAKRRREILAAHQLEVHGKTEGES